MAEMRDRSFTYTKLNNTELAKPMKIVATIEARMTSSRLPSSLLSPLVIAVLLAGSLASAARTLAQELPDWENPQVVGINKLHPHAPVYPFADPATDGVRRCGTR